MVKPCTCKHEFQDKKYGEGMRVHNYCPPAKSKVEGWRCTVCGEKK